MKKTVASIELAQSMPTKLVFLFVFSALEMIGTLGFHNWPEISILIFSRFPTSVSAKAVDCSFSENSLYPLAETNYALSFVLKFGFFFDSLLIRSNDFSPNLSLFDGL